MYVCELCLHQYICLLPDSPNSIFKEMMMDLQLPTTSPLHNTCFSIFIGEYIDVVIGSYWLVTGSVYTSILYHPDVYFGAANAHCQNPRFWSCLSQSLVGNFFGKLAKWQSQSSGDFFLAVRHTSNIKHACPQRKNCNYK